MSLVTIGSDKIPLFAPTVFLENTTQILTSEGILAIRCPVDFSYQLNGAGPFVSVPAGTILGINPRNTSIDFQASVTILEAM